MKKVTKKLSLEKQTVASLTDKNLQLVVGGVSHHPATCLTCGGPGCV
jgi:hypothetical protein